MELSDFVERDAVLTGLSVTSKKHLLRELAAEAARRTGVDEREVFDTLLQREKLGSTGTGGGVAIPHGKPRGLDRLFGMVVTLAKPIPFDAVDDQPVDIVFLLMAPEASGADHLTALARIARLMRTPDAPQRMRAARSPADLYAVLTDVQAQDAA